MARFTGKVAIITGAGGGIGSATARLLAKEGAQVVLADIDAGAANRVHDQIVGAGGESLVVKLDLADEASIVALIDATLQRFGKIDILDNNAADLSAGLFSLDHDIETMTAEVWDRTFLVNTRGTMLCCKYALAPMRKAGRGAIVNTASNLALQGNIIQAAYSASKAAVIQMTRSIATSHGQAGIRCNAVLPGLTASPTAIDKPAETIAGNRARGDADAVSRRSHGHCLHRRVPRFGRGPLHHRPGDRGGRRHVGTHSRHCTTARNDARRRRSLNMADAPARGVATAAGCHLATRAGQ